MSDWADIAKLRVTVNDPAGAIHIEQVAAEANLPSAPVRQYVYYSIATGKYWKTEVQSGATPADYIQPVLYLADDTIEELIDTHGYEKALYYAIRLILARLGKELSVVRMSTGTESTDYTVLRDLYEYYKDLSKVYEWQKRESDANTSGLYKKIHHTHIAGGNI